MEPATRRSRKWSTLEREHRDNAHGAGRSMFQLATLAVVVAVFELVWLMR
jgi:hypothetical protein